MITTESIRKLFFEQIKGLSARSTRTRQAASFKVEDVGIDKVM